MATDVGTVIGRAVGHAARDAAKSAAKNASANLRQRSNGSFNGTAKGVAAGVGLVALAPLAGKLVKKQLGDRSAQRVGDKLEGAKDAVSGAKNTVAEKVGELTGEEGPTGDIGSSRRMPVQQAVDVSLPISTVYNQWTQFEEWPQFMHRLDRVSQEDESHVTFKTKIWGISKEFEAEIVEQRPEELIRWQVTDGVTQTGVVSFHKLAPRLTRVDVDVYVLPGSLIEKAARGMRHVKRAVRADLARFKAYAELKQEESGAWRGVIEDAKVKSSRSGSSRRSRSSSRKSSSSRSSSSRSSSGKRSTSSSGRSRSESSGGSRSQSSGRSRSQSRRTRGANSGGSRSGGGRRRTRTTRS
jgi:uncharacterized membrane protein